MTGNKSGGGRIRLAVGKVGKRIAAAFSSPRHFYLFLASREYNTFTMALLIFMFLVWLLPFQIYGVPGQVIRNIATKEWLFRIPYLLFFVGAAACLVRTGTVVFRRIRGWGREPAAATAADLKREGWQVVSFSLSLPQEKVYARFVRLLRWRGYRVSFLAGGRGIYARRGKYAPLGTLFLHGSFFFLPLALLVGMYSFFYGYAVVTEGQAFFAGDKSSYFQTVVKGRGKPPQLDLRLDRIEPVFWEDKLLFTDLKADVAWPAADPVEYRTIRLNRPLFRDGVMIAIRGFGYAPYYVLVKEGSDWRRESFVNLRIFPPGAEDSFVVEGFPWRIKLSVLSDPVRKGNKLVNRSFNLVDPVFRVQLVAGEGKKEKVVYRQEIRAGEYMHYGGYSLMFPEVRYYGEFSVVKNPAAAVVFFAFVLAGTGLVLRLFWYRKEFILCPVGNGEFILAARGDYFRRLLQQELATFCRKLTK